METTTQKPPTSPGDGRGENSVSKRAGVPTDRNEPKPSPSTREEPKAEGSGLLAADGSSIAIGDGERRAIEGIRDFGRSASESWRKLSAAAEETARKNPTGTALGALAVGLIAGAAIGALLARD